MLSFQGSRYVHRRNDEKTARIEKIHAALRESIAAIKLLAADADGMLARRVKPSAKALKTERKPRTPV